MFETSFFRGMFNLRGVNQTLHKSPLGYELKMPVRVCHGPCIFQFLTAFPEGGNDDVIGLFIAGGVYLAPLWPPLFLEEKICVDDDTPGHCCSSSPWRSTERNGCVPIHVISCCPLRLWESKPQKTLGS